MFIKHFFVQSILVDSKLEILNYAFMLIYALIMNDIMLVRHYLDVKYKML